MKKKLFYIFLTLSLCLNVLYLNIKLNDKKHKEEFFSLFEVKNISYSNGFFELKKIIKNKKLEKPHYIIKF